MSLCYTGLCRTMYLQPASSLVRVGTVFYRGRARSSRTFTALSRDAAQYVKRTAQRSRGAAFYSSSTDANSSRETPEMHKEETVLHRLKRIESSLKFRGYSVLRVGLGFILVTGTGIYVFRDHLRRNVADEVSTVAAHSLGAETVKIKTEELVKAMLHAILTDPNVQDEAVRFLGKVLATPGTHTALQRLFTELLSDPLTQRRLLTLLKQLISRALSDPVFTHNLCLSLQQVLENPETQAALAHLLGGLLQDESLRQQARDLVRSLLLSAELQDEAVRAGRKVLGQVVGDDNVRRQTGDAIWSAVTYSVKPSWLGGGQAKSPTPPSTS